MVRKDGFFKMLGLEPNQPFVVKQWQNNTYRITPDLIIEVADNDGWAPSLIRIDEFLKHDLTIEAQVVPDEKGIAVINYAKACGYRYIAQDQCGECYAFKKKPVRAPGGEWINGGASFYIRCDCNFVSWLTSPYDVYNLK